MFRKQLWLLATAAAALAALAAAARPPPPNQRLPGGRRPLGINNIFVPDDVIIYGDPLATNAAAIAAASCARVGPEACERNRQFVAQVRRPAPWEARCVRFRGCRKKCAARSGGGCRVPAALPHVPPSARRPAAGPGVPPALRPGLGRVPLGHLHNAVPM